MCGWLILAYIIDKEGSEICSGLLLQEKHWTLCRHACKHTCTHTILIHFSLSQILYETIFSIYYSWSEGMEWGKGSCWNRDRHQTDGGRGNIMMDGWKWFKKVIWEVLKAGILLNKSFTILFLIKMCINKKS